MGSARSMSTSPRIQHGELNMDVGALHRLIEEQKKQLALCQESLESSTQDNLRLREQIQRLQNERLNDVQGVLDNFICPIRADVVQDPYVLEPTGGLVGFPRFLELVHYHGGTYCAETGTVCHDGQLRCLSTNQVLPREFRLVPVKCIGNAVEMLTQMRDAAREKTQQAAQQEEPRALQLIGE